MLIKLDGLFEFLWRVSPYNCSVSARRVTIFRKENIIYILLENIYIYYIHTNRLHPRDRKPQPKYHLLFYWFDCSMLQHYKTQILEQHAEQVAALAFWYKMTMKGNSTDISSFNTKNAREEDNISLSKITISHLLFYYHAWTSTLCPPMPPC